MKTILKAIALLLLAGAGPALAQQYPIRPIRMIIGFPPGGGTDIVGRIVGQRLSEVLGQQVLPDNRGGASGQIAAELTAKAPPDGYTVMMAHIAAISILPSLYPKMPYDATRDFAPISLVAIGPNLLVVHPSVPVKSVGELISHARANPGKLNYASVGPGSVTHLAHELFKLETKINLVHVPYKGGGPALNALVAGEVQVTAISLVPTLPHWRAGRLRPLGITTPTRSSLLPEVPTISETVPGFEVVHWYGIWGPKGLPRSIVERWNREVAKVLLTDEMRARTKAEGLDAGGGPPEALGAIIKRDVEKWRRTVKEAGIRSEG